VPIKRSFSIFNAAIIIFVVWYCLIQTTWRIARQINSAVNDIFRSTTHASLLIPHFYFLKAEFLKRQISIAVKLDFKQTLRKENSCCNFFLNTSILVNSQFSTSDVRFFTSSCLSYLRYVCLFEYNGVQHILWVFFLQLVYPMLPVSLD
jgi:NRPS condensation-like uncharacterized protein